MFPTEATLRKLHLIQAAGRRQKKKNYAHVIKSIEALMCKYMHLTNDN